MSTTSRYILSQISRPLLVSISIGLMLLLSERLIRLLELTLGQREAFSLVFEMLAYLVPHYLGLAVPGAFFIGLLLGFNRLSKDSEIDAFLAGGIGLHQLARPVVVLSVVFALFAASVFGFFQPYARHAYRAIVHTVKSTNVYYLAEAGVFMNMGNRTIVLDRVNRDQQRFGHIFIYRDFAARGHKTTTARDGFLIDRGPGKAPLLQMSDGLELRVRPPRKNQPANVVRDAQITIFDRIETLLGKDSDSALRPRGKDPRELTLVELWQNRNNNLEKMTSNEIKAELYDRLVRIMMIPLLPFLAIPFALSQRRSHRSYRFASAVILLVAFNEIIHHAKRAVALDKLPPIAAQGIPISIFAAIALWSFYRATFTLSQDRMEPYWDRLNDIFRAVWLRMKTLKRAWA